MAEHYPVEIAPPDIRPYRQGNTGVDYVHVLDSGKPGPNVMLQALTHGLSITTYRFVPRDLRERLNPPGASSMIPGSFRHR